VAATVNSGMISDDRYAAYVLSDELFDMNKVMTVKALCYFAVQLPEVIATVMYVPAAEYPA
jgi:hypothetical protein